MAETSAALPPARSALRQERASRGALHVLAAVFFLMAVGFALCAWIAGDVFYFRLGTEALIFAGLAISVDLLVGYTGLLSLG
jgi:branched-chain amino acid transport system permease protein